MLWRYSYQFSSKFRSINCILALELQLYFKHAWFDQNIFDAHDASIDKRTKWLNIAYQSVTATFLMNFFIANKMVYK